MAITATDAHSSAEAAPRTCDVLVVGSGAGGLAAAITAAQAGFAVVVVEKTAWFGGTSAYSGGGVWVPANAPMREAGYPDDRDTAEQYLHGVLGEWADTAKVQAYLTQAPDALAFFKRVADLELVPSGMVDYESELVGATRSRTLLSPEYDGRQLGPLLRHLRSPLPQVGGPLGLHIGLADVQPLLDAHRSARALIRTLQLALRHVIDLIRFGKASRLCNGNALVARLLKGASDAGVTLLRETEVTGLVSTEGRISGASLTHGERRWTLTATRGVVLASGGFAADPALRALHVPLAADTLVLQAEGNTGDGLRLAEQMGGRLASGNHANGIWTPMSQPPGTGPFPHIVRDRFLPGGIVVDPHGRRFVDESSHYQRFCEVMQERAIGHAFLIGDARFVSRCGLGLARAAPWSNTKLVRSGYLIEAHDVPDLARRIGADPAVLTATIAAFNDAAADGNDRDHGRGQTVYARDQGEPGPLPNPNLGPIERPPFYAVKLSPGMLSSSLGLETDARARVLDKDNAPIEGLFAVGVDMNSPWRGHYPGGGASLGSALTFGYVAGRALAGNA